MLVEILKNHQQNIMLSLATMCGVIAIYVWVTGSSNMRKRALFFCEITAMFLLMSDRSAYIYRGDISLMGYIMTRVSNFMLFLLNLVLILSFNQYVKEVIRDRVDSFKSDKLFNIVDYLCILGCVFIVLSQFTGLYYSFDWNNNYYRGPLFPISYIFPLLSLMIQFVIVMKYHKYVRSDVVLSLCLIILAPFVGAVIQYFIYGVSFTNIFLVIAVILLFLIDLQDLKRQGNATKKMAEKLHAQLLSIADTYRSAHDINLVQNTFSEIVVNYSDIRLILGAEYNDAQERMNDIMDHFTAPQYKQDIMAFVDFSTLEERMHGLKTVAMEFVSNEKIWYRGRFVKSEYTQDGKLSHVLWIIENIDVEKKNREELEKMSKQAMAANDAKTAFLGRVSREIRTPINAVLGMNEMILRESHDQNILAYSKSIKASGRTLLGLVGDILDFSKLEAGNMEIVPVDFGISSLINDLVSFIQIEAENKGLLLEYEFDDNIPKTINGDVVRIKQIIATLLSNAIQYTEKGKITFCIQSEKIPEEPDYILLNVSIKDTGIGMSSELLDKITSYIEKGRNITGVDATTLSISITNKLLTMMESRLYVESQENVGSSFSFSVKQKVVNWEPAGDIEAVIRMEEGIQDTYKQFFTAPTADILVVDDNDINLEVFKALVSKFEVKVDTAENGEECVDITRGKKYDIIFLDHMMPIKNGIEALQDIKAQKDNPNLNTPAICLTANAAAGAKEEFIALGFNDYMAKPMDPTKLDNMMMEYLPSEKIVMTSDDCEELGADVQSTSSVILSKLSSQKLINLEEGVKNSGSEDAYVSLLKLFYESANRKMSEIQDLYDKGNINDFIIKIYAAKSSANIIGAIDLGKEAEKLEEAAKKVDLLYVTGNIDKFVESYLQIKYLLSAVFKAQKVDYHKPIADADLMKKAYDKIREAAEIMDFDGLENVFKSMEKYQIPQDEKALYIKLEETARNFDYEQILNVLMRSDNK